jgi:hypothetical protein
MFKIKNKKNHLSEIEKIGVKYNTLALILIFIGFLLVLSLPWLLSQYSWKFGFSETGQIGDTIGGITAPVIGFMSAILIYFSFKIQFDANKRQWRAFLSESRLRYISDLSNEIDNIIQNLLKNNKINLLDHAISEAISQDYSGLTNENEISFLSKDRTKIGYKLNIFIEKNLLLYDIISKSEIDEEIRRGLLLEYIRKESGFYPKLESIKNNIYKVMTASFFKKFPDHQLWAFLHVRIEKYFLTMESSQGELRKNDIPTFLNLKNANNK